MPFQTSLLRSPSVISTANCRISGIFLGFSPSNGRWEPNVGVSKTRAERALLQIVVQSRFVTPELATVDGSWIFTGARDTAGKELLAIKAGDLNSSKRKMEAGNSLQRVKMVIFGEP